uniref:Uncharacterized protein n=1 Tax=Mycena chlorophos TaxID=658473 RepID=A0ABQ0KWD6_MYCCL|nr:predicted protein [Mycena chlorophos]
MSKICGGENKEGKNSPIDSLLDGVDAEQEGDGRGAEAREEENILMEDTFYGALRLAVELEAWPICLLRDLDAVRTSNPNTDRMRLKSSPTHTLDPAQLGSLIRPGPNPPSARIVSFIAPSPGVLAVQSPSVQPTRRECRRFDSPTPQRPSNPKRVVFASSRRPFGALLRQGRRLSPSKRSLASCCEAQAAWFIDCGFEDIPHCLNALDLGWVDRRTSIHPLDYPLSHSP